ncbi:D-Ala-D-Ala carboxypeptidase family metallohydrolase [Rhizobium sp. EC-SD404]|uniref:YcbK family protein n=1 Tax=Rhizobium sp. EC-SD404 TaxID=2038389 RepID=UPI001254D95C|nr:D-Ala-D-Ala carboxypeptidase family metallohydrolase [Rhizobium sp. EC-SD404]VVT17548.1 conserved exported hypothetical protein [Rhizobium sp. EC-SD404]
MQVERRSQTAHILKRLAGATALLGLLSACAVSDDGQLGFNGDPSITTSAISAPSSSAGAFDGNAPVSSVAAAVPGDAAPAGTVATDAETEAAVETAAADTVPAPTIDAQTAEAAVPQATVEPEQAVAVVAPEAAADVATQPAATTEPQQIASAEQAATATTAPVNALSEETDRGPSPFARLFSRSSDGETRPVVQQANDRAPQPIIDLGDVDDESVEPEDEVAEEAPPSQITTASIESSAPRARLSVTNTDGPVLPGVREVGSLYQLQHRDGFDYNSYSDDNGTVQLASAAGIAGLAGGRLRTQHERVDVACLKPQLVQTLKRIEAHFGRPVLVTSGFRDRGYNRKVGGARESRHMYCEAADIQVPGVSKWQIAEYARSLPGRGGVGTYCHTDSVHVDIGSKRDWNWRCRRRS